MASNAARRRYDPASKPVLTNGQSIRYASVDNVGNVEAVHTAVAHVDKNAPTTTDDVPAGFQKADVTVTLGATDGAESGVATTWYTTDGSDPTLAGNPARKAYDPAGKPVLTNAQSIRYASVDNVGHIEAVRTSPAAKVDKTAPTTTDDVPTTTRPSAITVTLTAADAGSGVAATWYTTDGSDPTVASNPARRAYDATAKPTLSDGQRIAYYTVDAVGNAEAVRVSAVASVKAPAPAPADGGSAAGAADTLAAPVTPSALAAAPAAPAPVAAPAASPVASTGSGVLPVRIAPLRAASAQASGIPLTVTVPAGGVVEVQVTRLTGDQPVAAAAVTRKRLTTIYRFPKRAGAFRMRLAGAALRRQLKPGVYELRIRAGKTRTSLGAPTVKKFRITR